MHIKSAKKTKLLAMTIWGVRIMEDFWLYT